MTLERQAGPAPNQLQQTIIRDLQSRYYRAVNAGKLRQAGISGMLKSLNDPWTEYLTSAQMKLLSKELRVPTRASAPLWQRRVPS